MELNETAAMNKAVQEWLKREPLYFFVFVFASPTATTTPSSEQGDGSCSIPDY